ncbi:hypothetical protein DICVIV_01300 [Dictyocaulus viviparus]|uniref:Uncharacterized protein n=1 Tax=Dictyocaulus viviparus TaxID=29172 RepID=A0A0D8Y6U8_DICVI|nr:hypothetical protein DICVIV_01300 [Dictyocaulus viviparus]
MGHLVVKCKNTQQNHIHLPKVSTFRACDARRKGLDRTLFGHIAVVFVDEVQPFLTGCVALDNQSKKKDFKTKKASIHVALSDTSKNLLTL